MNISKLLIYGHMRTHMAILFIFLINEVLICFQKIIDMGMSNVAYFIRKSKKFIQMLNFIKVILQYIRAIKKNILT